MEAASCQEAERRKIKKKCILDKHAALFSSSADPICTYSMLLIYLTVSDPGNPISDF